MPKYQPAWFVWYIDRQMQASTASQAAVEAVGRVFHELLEAALKDAAAGAFEDEEDNEGTGMISHTVLLQFLNAVRV